jgi:putative ATPase
MSGLALRADFGGVLRRRRPEEGVRGGAARARWGGRTLLFVDEIHRFNRAQQDGFLPVMEDGTWCWSARRPRTRPSSSTRRCCRGRGAGVPVARPEELEKLLARAEAVEGKKLPLDDEARAALVRMADGDGRAALTLAEEVWRAGAPGERLDKAEAAARVVQRRAPIYDKKQDGHYNLISALHKSVRGSDPDAALYYLARMLDAGEDPLFLGRRLVRMAVEDIGLADPQALVDRHRRQGRLRLARLARRANWRWRRPASISRPRRNRTPSTPPSRRRCALAKEHWLAAAAEAHPQRADQADEGEGYGAGYRYDHDSRTAFRGRTISPRRWAGSPSTIRRARLRARDPQAARLLGEAARAEAPRWRQRWSAFRAQAVVIGAAQSSARKARG